jgi:predicted dehydrogenase
MLDALVIGLGRAGLGLHLPVLTRLRLCRAPVVAVDPNAPRGHPQGPPVTVLRTLRQARDRLAPQSTVVHLCTPPAVRADVLREVAALGFTRVIVEKPLAADDDELERTLRISRDHGLRLCVVAPWLHSTLTDRLVALIQGGDLGRLHTVSITQHKPRFRRSSTSRSHESAFDVEIPHALGLALRLAGDAEVVSARATDLDLGGEVVRRMGSAHLTLHHHDKGVRTVIDSDLTSPVRQRRVVLSFTAGGITADYPIGQDDDYGQLRVTHANGRGDAAVREVVQDEALGTFFTRAYRRYAGSGAPGRDTELEEQVRCCRLLLDAKRRAFTRTPLERTP